MFDPAGIVIERTVFVTHVTSSVGKELAQMSASPRQPPSSDKATDSDQPTAETLAAKLFEVVKQAGFGRGPPVAPSDPDKILHHEITKMKATTLNALALAFLIGGGVAPIVSWSTTGVSVLQAALGAVWLTCGMLLHYGVRRILRTLVP